MPESLVRSRLLSPRPPRQPGGSAHGSPYPQLHLPASPEFGAKFRRKSVHAKALTPLFAVQV
jgi:hypothetical protein